MIINLNFSLRAFYFVKKNLEYFDFCLLYKYAHDLLNYVIKVKSKIHFNNKEKNLKKHFSSCTVASLIYVHDFFFIRKKI